MALRIIGIVVACIAVFALYQYLRTRHYIGVGVALAEEAAPRKFERLQPGAQMRILNIGDSSVVGTGATDETLTVAGRLAADYPGAEVVNLGVNGTRTKGLIERFEGIQEEHFDLIVIHTGGNDIVRFTDYEELEGSLRVVLGLAEHVGDRVLLLHGGNIGTSRLFPFGLRWILTKRTREVRDIWMRVVEDFEKVTYVDMWHENRSEDPYWTEPRKYYGPDFFHPSEYGYGHWYEDHIKLELGKLGL